MRNKLGLVVALGLALVTARAGFAGEVEDVLGKISVREAGRASVLLEKQVKAYGCEDFQLAEIDSVAVIRVPKDAEGKLGTWTTRYLARACGKPWKGNVLFDASRGPLTLEALVPGETRADPQLQKDVVKSFTMAALRAKPVCKEAPVVRMTTVSKRPKDALDVWQEIWIGRACKVDVGQVVTFMPNAKGVAFKMALTAPAKAVTPTTK